MANIKSQKKRNLTNAKSHERNKAVKAEMKTRTKRVETTLGTDDPGDHVVGDPFGGLVALRRFGHEGVDADPRRR